MNSTTRQQQAVRYCETWLNVDFNGNINSFNDCSRFLNVYLEHAKQTAQELRSEYESYLWSKL